jgi:predicted dithiol-disulfide oxidoreductase (DUF899 family)
MSAFVLEDGVVYHTYFHLFARSGRHLGHVSVARPRGPKGRNETGVWGRRYDEYNKE